MTNEPMTNQPLLISVDSKLNLQYFSPKPYTFNPQPYKIFQLLAIFTK